MGLTRACKVLVGGVGKLATSKPPSVEASVTALRALKTSDRVRRLSNSVNLDGLGAKIVGAVFAFMGLGLHPPQLLNALLRLFWARVGGCRDSQQRQKFSRFAELGRGLKVVLSESF